MTEETRGNLSRDFNDDGFVKVTGLFSVAEVSAFKQEIHRVLDTARAQSVARGDTAESVAADGVFVGLAARSKLFRTVASETRLLDALEALLGPDIEFLSDKVVFKAAGVEYGSPWHQDWPYWEGAHKISVWIALDAATPENGCLKMLPGSHRQAAPHQDIATPPGEGFSLRPRPEAVDESRTVSVPAEPGDAIFFHDLTLHASFPNRSGQDRWALISTYRSASEPDLAYEWAVAAQLVRGSRGDEPDPPLAP
jgi:ectoine hydroxylase-related dioxygenase (phytanoyl-CoA dioxygenase family)